RFKQDPANLAGDVLTALHGAATTGQLSNLAERLGPQLATPMSTGGAASQITNAFNPAPKQAAGFESNLETHMPKALQYAADHKIPMNSRQGLATALKGAADSERSLYYDKILGPVKNELVSTTGIPGYAGETAGPGGSATLAQLDTRLSQVNATLFGDYE